MNASDFVFRVARVGQTFDPAGMGFPAPECADVERFRTQGHMQRGVIELRVVGQGHHRGAVVNAERCQRVVRPVLAQCDTRKSITYGKGAAWIDDNHLITRGLGKGDKRLGDMHRADNDHPFGRIENLREQRGVVASQAAALVVTQRVARGFKGLGVEVERTFGPVAEDEGLLAGLEIRYERDLLLGRAGRQE